MKKKSGGSLNAKLIPLHLKNDEGYSQYTTSMPLSTLQAQTDRDGREKETKQGRQVNVKGETVRSIRKREKMNKCEEQKDWGTLDGEYEKQQREYR